MSIFTKDCPVCAASHPVHAVRCGCGHCFDPNKLDGVTQELEVIAQEERLYRDYLAARADQAEQAMRAARTAAAMNPGNTVKAAEALLAEQAALTARAELEAQGARAHAVKARVKVVRSNRRARRQAKASASAPRPAPASVRAALAPPVRIELSPPPLRPTPRAEPPPAPSPAATVAAKNSKPTPLAPAAKPVKSASAPPAVTALTHSPRNAANRHSVIRSPGADVATSAPTLTLKPTPIFRTAQATKAAQFTAAPAAPTSQDCPNCSAKVSLRAKRCRCGYELPQSASQIPSLTMSPEDRAAFRAALSPRRTDRNS